MTEREDDVSELFERAGRSATYLDGYRLCGPGCPQPAADGSCASHSDCTSRGCDCHLFARSALDPPQDPDSWKHKADPGEPHSDIAGQVYRCFCVEAPSTTKRE